MFSFARGIRRDENGVVLPTRIVVGSIAVVALAGLGFVATQPDEPADTAKVVKTTPKPSPTVTPTTSTPKPKPKPAVRRASVYVVVFNNSNIHGLAAGVATKAQGLGWNVVGSDNWYGTIDTSTVYYPPQLQDAAKLLAKDLGINRVKPAIDPMSGDRLTVILTGPV